MTSQWARPDEEQPRPAGSPARRAAVAALGLALLLASGACAQSPDEPRGKTTPHATGSTTTPSPSIEGSVAAPASPGTIVDLGTTVVVPFVPDPFFAEDDPIEGTLQVTVTDPPKRGPGQPDVNGARVATSKVRFIVVNVGDTDLGGSLVYLDGYRRDRQQGHGASTGGHCNAGLPTPFTQGDSADLCSIVYANPSALTDIAWSIAPAYEDQPVRWRLR